MAPPYAVSPPARAPHARVGWRREDGLQCLKNPLCCRSSLGIISPAEGPVWITFALASDDAASAFCLPKVCTWWWWWWWPFTDWSPASTQGTSTARATAGPVCPPPFQRCTGMCGVHCVRSPCSLGCSDVPRTRMCSWSVAGGDGCRRAEAARGGTCRSHVCAAPPPRFMPWVSPPGPQRP